MRRPAVIKSRTKKPTWSRNTSLLSGSCRSIQITVIASLAAFPDLCLQFPGAAIKFLAMKLQDLLLLCGLPLASTEALAQSAPRFADYPVAPLYTGKTAAPVLATKDAREFRTMLRQAAAGKTNFAGHYILATWGCGSSCVSGGIIDARSGAVTMLPFTTCCFREVHDKFEPIEVRPASRLIVFSGARDEKEDDMGQHFYAFEKGKLAIPAHGEERRQLHHAARRDQPNTTPCSCARRRGSCDFTSTGRPSRISKQRASVSVLQPRHRLLRCRT